MSDSACKMWHSAAPYRSLSSGLELPAGWRAKILPGLRSALCCQSSATDARVSRWLRILGALLLWLTIGAQLRAESIQPVQIEPPSRNYGYLIGDILVQKVKTGVALADISSSELDHLQRVNAYLARLPVPADRIDHQGWLTLQYQLINIPHETRWLSLPSLQLETINGDLLQIDEWPFSAGSLLPKSIDATFDATALRADMAARTLLPAATPRALKTSAVLLIMVLAMWLLWWLYREFSERHHLPFARARQTIKQRDATADDSPGWIALHHAFNATAGSSIGPRSLADLLASAPWLAEQENEIAAFYQASEARFYDSTAGHSHFDVGALCEVLYRLEKRQAGAGSVAGTGAGH